MLYTLPHFRVFPYFCAPIRLEVQLAATLVSLFKQSGVGALQPVCTPPPKKEAFISLPAAKKLPLLVARRQVLISGAVAAIDVEELKKHCRYAGGFTQVDKVVGRFWKVRSSGETCSCTLPTTPQPFKCGSR